MAGTHEGGNSDERPGEDIDYQAFVANTADVNLVESLDGRCQYASAACRRLFGWDPEDLEGHVVDEFVHPDDLVVVRATRADLPELEFVSARYRFLCRDGAYRWIEASSHYVDTGDTWLVVSTLRDIAQRQAYEADLQIRARTDPLTGVANRTVLMDRINQGVRRLDRAEGGLAVLYLDLDRFKAINDSLGHDVGDRVLVAVADRLAHQIRPSDTLARLGGDEFVIVVDGMPGREAVSEVAERILSLFRPGIPVNGEVFECTLSIGIAWTTEADRDAADLLREADLALYRAKETGRDRAEVFDDELRVSARGRLSTEHMLRRAIDEGRIVVEYQPIVDLRDRRPVSVEALVRVRADDASLLPPARFLEVAEQSGLLVEIDDLVLTDALGRARTWRLASDRTGALDVAVNITARHLADITFHDAIVAVLERSGVPPRALRVELTERTLLEASNTSVAALRDLRETGVKVSLDDFGAGHASVMALRRFPLDYVKIDRSLVGELEQASTGRSLVGAMISMAHAIGLTVVAEGVETDTEHAVLQDLGCDQAQGYLFARPAGADVVSRALGEHPGR